MNEASWLLLREACLRGVCPADDGAADLLVAAGYAQTTPRGVAPTSAGRAALEGWARLPDGSPEEQLARRVYDTFLTLDLELKTVATEWQTSGAAKRTGLDAAGWKLVDRLITIDERAGPPLRKLGEAVPRFSLYRTRLRDALKKLEDGGLEYFTGLRVDSYHTIWWHLHQDLLWALGIARGDDPNQ